MPDYAWAHLAHLFFAVIFVGGVFFRGLGFERDAHLGRFARIAPRSRTCFVPTRRKGDALGGGGRIFVRPDHGLSALSAELGRALRFFLQPATDAESDYCGKHPAAFCRGRYENAAAHADQSLVALYPYRRAVAHDADC